MASLIEPGIPAFDVGRFTRYCRLVHFAAGDVLRKKGQHYRDMYLMVSGVVEVDLGTGSEAGQPLVAGARAPIGEIGFLRGSAAVATVTARTAADALVLDDPALARIERSDPVLAADLFRYLARTAVERTSFNLTLSSPGVADRAAIDIYLCRDEDMLGRAKRLRYEVYCDELGRNSPYADHRDRTITDHLDQFGHTFIAVEEGETIGTLRSNLSREGDLGVLIEVYGMGKSVDHPEATAICTKFIVRKGKRGGMAATKLISAMVGLGLRSGIRACYIDTIPSLRPYYQALGFTQSGDMFFHRENGPSYPMVLDLTLHGEQLAKETGALKYLKTFVRAQASPIRSVATPDSETPG
ncbi:MAG TPA: cyclic nucleotide-binding domain-containing protein [Bauldia sp.]|nr:cyclic nucleotide-binding domain-containing protein [Bauldia sp.]